MTPELARLIAAQICIHACMAGMRMATPLLALREGYSALAVGVLLALFALMQVFLALPAGRFADRHGLKRPIRLCVLAAVIGTAAAVVWPSYWVMCLSALASGGATGTAIIAVQRHVGRAVHSTTQLRKVFSWLSLGPAVSSFIGPFSAGLLIDHAGAVAGDTTGYRAAFFLMAVFPMAAWWFIHRTQELPVVPPVPDATRGSALDLLKDKMFRQLLLVNWFLSSCWDVHTFVVPVLGHERGLSASSIGTILGGFAIAAAAVRMVLPILAERVREWAVIAGSMAVTAVLFGIYPFMPSAAGMLVCSVLLGLALGAVQPMVMSTLHQITPVERYGEALGLRIMAINLSSVSMPMLFGAMGAVVGISGVFWVVGAVVGMGTPTALRLRLDAPPAT